MKFAFEIAHEVAMQREHLIMEMVETTVVHAEIAFANAEKIGQYNIEVELPIALTHEHLRAEYEKAVVEKFEAYGYIIDQVTPWKWFISCDPSLWESE